jgi:hypothetical protein
MIWQNGGESFPGRSFLAPRLPGWIPFASTSTIMLEATFSSGLVSTMRDRRMIPGRGDGFPTAKSGNMLWLGMGTRLSISWLQVKRNELKKLDTLHLSEHEACLVFTRDDGYQGFGNTFFLQVDVATLQLPQGGSMSSPVLASVRYTCVLVM